METSNRLTFYSPLFLMLVLILMRFFSICLELRLPLGSGSIPFTFFSKNSIFDKLRFKRYFKRYMALKFSPFQIRNPKNAEIPSSVAFLLCIKPCNDLFPNRERSSIVN